MKAPYISIIVPVYNVESYLKECIESIIKQEGNFELILVNDGSPDKSGEICDEYSKIDSRIKVIHKSNGGVSSARNAGLDIAKGEWIWFVDSDDIVDISRLNEIVLWLENHPEVDYVLLDMKEFYDSNNPTFESLAGDIKIIDSFGNKEKFLEKYHCYYHPRIFYKRSTMCYSSNELRFTNGLRVCEDGEFQFKYLMLCKHPARIFYTIYYYRKREGSATQNAQSKKYIVEDTQKVLYKLLDFIIENKITIEEWLKQRIEGTLKNLLNASCISGDYKSKIFQKNIRVIIDSYRNKGYSLFNNIFLGIAYINMPMYCFLHKLNLKLKGIDKTKK